MTIITAVHAKKEDQCEDGEEEKGKRKAKAGANEVVKKQRRDQDHCII